jgi:hypothetical protein
MLISPGEVYPRRGVSTHTHQSADMSTTSKRDGICTTNSPAWCVRRRAFANGVVYACGSMFPVRSVRWSFSDTFRREGFPRGQVPPFLSLSLTHTGGGVSLRTHPLATSPPRGDFEKCVFPCSQHVPEVWEQQKGDVRRRRRRIYIFFVPVFPL